MFFHTIERALARHKSEFRKRLNGRWLRWKLARGIFRLLPNLARRYSFPMSSATATDTATRIIERDDVVESGDFTPDEIARVLQPALASDKIRSYHDSPGASRFVREYAVLGACAVLGHSGAVVRAGDGAVVFLHAARVPNWNLAQPKRLRSRDMGPGLVTSLMVPRHYFHFFEQLLPLIDYLNRHHPPQEPLTVLVPETRLGFQQPMCDAVTAAYPCVTFVPLGADERAETARYLWLLRRADNAEWLCVTPDEAARFGALLRAHYGQPEPKGRDLVFVTRGAAPLRRLINEEALVDIAVRHGFQVFEPSAGDHAAQVAAFGNARVIVAVHGAGLTNLLFARPGTVVIEIFPSNFIKSTYLWLSRRLGLEHHALIGSSGDYDQAFACDPALFSAKLDEVLAPVLPRVRVKAPSRPILQADAER